MIKSLNEMFALYIKSCFVNIPSKNLLGLILVIELLGSHPVGDLLVFGHSGVMLVHCQGNTTAICLQLATHCWQKQCVCVFLY